MFETSCIFMGTPKIAADVLKTMLDAGIKVDLVVTQPDKRVGRKQKITVSQVKQVALDYGIDVFQPVRIREDFQPILDKKPKLIVTCAYGQIVPDEILNYPIYGCVNLHGSLLPKYRGGAPIQRAIWDGEKISGMSLMKMATKMDAGPVLDTEEILLDEKETSTTLFERMAQAAGKLILKNYEIICSDKAEYVEQDLSEVTFAPIIKKEEEHIDLQQSDERILCQIRALDRTPGAYFKVGNKKWKVFDVDYVTGTTQPCGVITGWNYDSYTVSLHQGLLCIHTCQMEGKPVMSAKDFYNGQGRNLVGRTVE
ncbi:MAG: methionyl-tRNA formyltransferase [Erysipelotrichaceae bacterium]|nr:methionyl-tRNA formyltransferase [Erysipelotrichaceae bacterium]